MKSSKISRLNKRVLKLNVGFLLSDGPGHNHDSNLNVPTPIEVADDLTLNYIQGNLRLSRAKEGILLQATLQVGVENICSRCLDGFSQDLTVHLEELYAHLHLGSSEFVIYQDGVLDLAPLLRAEVLILSSQRMLCQLDCKGLCPECGTNWNHETCTCDVDPIDPRLAALKQLLRVDD